MIKVEDLKKSYGEKTVLKGINFQVKKGEIFGFLGPNGAGKTTTIKIITGQLLPSFGRAFVQGMDTVQEKEKIRPRIGVVPEQANLYERLTIRQNLEYFCRLYQCDFTRIDYYLEKVGLIDEKSTQVKNLSKGMRQKTLLIRALLHNPEILLLDEPTSGLDPASADSIHRILMGLNQEGTTILLTSHNMEEVEKLCCRVAFLSKGSILTEGNPENLKLQYSTGKVRLLLETESGIEKKTVDMEGKESADLSNWIRKGMVKSIHSSEATLADIFVQVTGEEIE